MRRVTESEIEEMRARGYDAATVREAREAFENGKAADRIIERIAEAFAGVTLGDGVGLHQAQGLDDYEDEATCAAYREADEKEDWRKIYSTMIEVPPARIPDEPGAVIPHAGICTGGVGQPASLP